MLQMTWSQSKKLHQKRCYIDSSVRLKEILYGLENGRTEQAGNMIIKFFNCKHTQSTSFGACMTPGCGAEYSTSLFVGLLQAVFLS